MLNYQCTATLMTYLCSDHYSACGSKFLEELRPRGLTDLHRILVPNCKTKTLPDQNFHKKQSAETTSRYSHLDHQQIYLSPVSLPLNAHSLCMTALRLYQLNYTMFLGSSGSVFLLLGKLKQTHTDQYC